MTKSFRPVFYAFLFLALAGGGAVFYQEWTGLSGNVRKFSETFPFSVTYGQESLSFPTLSPVLKDVSVGGGFIRARELEFDRTGTSLSMVLKRFRLDMDAFPVSMTDFREYRVPDDFFRKMPVTLSMGGCPVLSGTLSVVLSAEKKPPFKGTFIFDLEDPCFGRLTVKGAVSELSPPSFFSEHSVFGAVLTDLSVRYRPHEFLERYFLFPAEKEDEGKGRSALLSALEKKPSEIILYTSRPGRLKIDAMPLSSLHLFLSELFRALEIKIAID